MRSPQEATNTVEMYLRIVYECEEEGLAALRARIGERLGHRPPTVSETVARMVRDGLIILTDTRELRFTEVGRGKAVSVMRKHRVVERFLADVIGLAWDQLHPEASRWQHVISDKVERLIAGRLRPPFRCPHGAPIPGLEVWVSRGAFSRPTLASSTKPRCFLCRLPPEPPRSSALNASEKHCRGSRV
ncbi:metal-dependent transcriptional regulator [Streptomyces sp. PB17]|uniref:metal-dependent transcriptional regulator n=1 Tax=Streptomyces sp. PB17 TaxID=3384158 RepID=UPI0038B46D31